MSSEGTRGRPGKSGRVTIHTVAELAGVSVATVSRVLNDSDRVKRSTRERVLKVLRESGFQHPSRLARALRTRRTGLIGLLVADILNPYYAVLARETEDAAKENGMTMLLSNDDGDDAVGVERLELFGSLNVDGVFVATWVGETPKRQTMRRLRENGVCVMCVNDMIGESEFDCVAVDYHTAAREAVRHLVGLGHRRIGFIGLAAGDNRARGYMAEMAACGLPTHMLTLRSVVSPRRLKDLLPREFPQFLAGNGLTAIITHNDMYALEAIRVARSIGYQVPQDLSVIGFDNVPQGETSAPPLSTFAPPYREMVRASIEVVRARVEREPGSAPVKKVLPAAFVSRESDAPAAAP